MFKQLYFLSLGLLVINLGFTKCDGSYSGANYESGGRFPQFKHYFDADLANLTNSRGLALSAWGIVTVITSIILLIYGMYYFSICYPVICKKERKYDMKDLTVA